MSIPLGFRREASCLGLPAAHGDSQEPSGLK